MTNNNLWVGMELSTWIGDHPTASLCVCISPISSLSPWFLVRRLHDGIGDTKIGLVNERTNAQLLPVKGGKVFWTNLISTTTPIFPTQPTQGRLQNKWTTAAAAAATSLTKKRTKKQNCLNFGPIDATSSPEKGIFYFIFLIFISIPAIRRNVCSVGNTRSEWSEWRQRPMENEYSLLDAGSVNRRSWAVEMLGRRNRSWKRCLSARLSPSSERDLWGCCSISKRRKKKPMGSSFSFEPPAEVNLPPPFTQKEEK